MPATSPIGDLIKEIKEGALILPEFQRGYVWKPDQVKRYLVSLYRKYPTGHFLIWKTYNPQPARGENPPPENSFSRIRVATTRTSPRTRRTSTRSRTGHF